MKMKLFFLLFLVILLWSNINALQCVNRKNPVRFDASELTEAKEFIGSLDTAEGYKACTVIFGVIYPQKMFVLVFNDGITGPSNMDVVYEMNLTMALNESIEDPASGYKVFTFMCDDENSCERQFWHDHIDWFIKEESNVLEAALRSILITELNQTGKIDTFTTNRKVS